MNDKIKQLAEDAGFMLWANEEWNPGDVVDWSARYDDELQKFAELIVQECAKLVEDNMDPQNAWITPGFIKEHFGVEK
jgi:hypothetical protein